MRLCVPGWVGGGGGTWTRGQEAPDGVRVGLRRGDSCILLCGDYPSSLPSLRPSPCILSLLQHQRSPVLRTTNSPRDHADAADVHVSGGAGHFTAGELKVAHPAAVRLPPGRTELIVRP